MINKLILESTADREAWLVARKKGLGSSDAAAICGLSKYATPYSVWLDKTGQAPEREETEAMQLGTRLEPVIASLFVERTRMVIERCGALMQHADLDWMLATPDYLVTDETGKLGLLEIKLTSSYNAGEWEHRLPDVAHIQVMHQLAVTGLPFAYVCALVGGTSLKYIRVERDEKIIEQLIEIERDFWENHVLTKIPPSLTGADVSLIDALYPQSSGRSIDADDLEPLASKYLIAKEVARAAEEEVDRIQAEIKNAIGDAEKVNAGEYRISWKNQVRTSIDSKLLKSEMPDIYEKFSKQSPSRPFTIKKIAD